MIELPDEFLSEEDLDIKHMSEEELHAWWNHWLELAQSTNDEDAHEYSHGVFMLVNKPTSDFSDLSGVWSTKDVEEFENRTADLRIIDHDEGL